MLKIGKYNVRIVNKGDRYGREDCLTHDDDRPMAEFYDRRYASDDYEKLRWYATRARRFLWWRAHRRPLLGRWEP